MNRIQTLMLLSASALMLACGGDEAVQSTSNLGDNSPLGQAGVVDETSDPNILQVAIGSKVTQHW